jgi:LCP family protein required for cell wall assembly
MAQDDPPEYKLYRSRPRLGRRDDGGDELDELRRATAGDDAVPPRAGARVAEPPYEPPAGAWPPEVAPPPPPRPRRRLPRLPGFRRRRRLSVGRVVRRVLLLLVAWVVLSGVLFVVSAQIQHGKLADQVGPELAGGPWPLLGANTVLVLGSDARPAGSKEPGADPGGPSRSDSIMLLRIGGGANASLSIPRDTIVDIPGHGRDKINAAFAIGGPALAVRTVSSYLGIPVNHVVEVSFENFPELIDALGGVKYTGGCVVSRINGGSRNGGYTLRLPAGTREISGKQALALARTRKNECNPAEDDRTRARRQQKLVSAMKDKVTSLETFVRLPWVAWAAPKAVTSDMTGPTLLGLVGGALTGGGSHQQVLKASGGVTLPNGGAGLVVDEGQKARQVAKFLRG